MRNWPNPPRPFIKGGPEGQILKEAEADCGGCFMGGEEEEEEDAH